MSTLLYLLLNGLCIILSHFNCFIYNNNFTIGTTPNYYKNKLENYY